MRMVKRNKGTLIIVGTYSLGKERIFIALARALGVKACVSQQKMAMLKMVAPELLKDLTTSSHLTRLHVLPIGQLSKSRIRQHLSENKKRLPSYSSVLAWKPTGQAPPPPGPPVCLACQHARFFWCRPNSTAAP